MITQKYIHSSDDSSFSELQKKSYSRMKHGVNSDIIEVANDIYTYLEDHILHMNNPVFVTVSKKIPSPSNYLTAHIQNKHKDKYGLGAIPIINLRREQDDLEGISSLHHEKRSQYRLSKLHIEKADIIKIKNASDVVVIDDIFVAGTFTNLITNKLASQDLSSNIHFVYYVRVDSGTLFENPYYERTISHYEINHIEKMILYLEAETILPTRRLAKLILNSTELELASLLNRTTKKNQKTIAELLMLIDTEDLELRRFFS
jgi:hypothetical protein